MPAPPRSAAAARHALLARYRAIRAFTEALCEPLAVEDMVVQTMPDVSPTKWHLAHTTWFFETFLLRSQGSYRVFHPRFAELFNSYYRTVGDMHPRPERGLLSRPTVAEILAYRRHVDEAMTAWLEGDAPLEEDVLEIGLQHEQQHQELLLMDVQHVLSCNPLRPAYREARAPAAEPAAEPGWTAHEGGIVEVGRDEEDEGFSFDNERPRHRVWLEPFALATRPVTCGEFAEFVADRGYERSELWLADGFDLVERLGWRAPAYWSGGPGAWRVFTLHGERELDPQAPVSHVSYYEADAFARWAGARLPTEAEWEVVAREADPAAGRFADSEWLHPTAAAPCGERPAQMFGDVWEWTASAYAPYPGYRPLEGSLGEYNGKFMANQMVLRGGCRLTPPGHVRATYRNFFYPHQRWQMAGLRLARDLR